MRITRNCVFAWEPCNRSHLSLPRIGACPSEGVSGAFTPSYRPLRPRHRSPESLEGFQADVMLDTLCVNSCRISTHAQRTQECLDDLVALAAHLRDRLTGF